MNCADNFTAKKPQFFKIILENTINERKLGIPGKFVKEFGDDLPEYVFLEVPDGSQWKIKLEKSQDGKVCMQQGWLDFAKHYSLSCGNLLVFNPFGVSKFHVVIFDMTGTEIKYAPMLTRSTVSKKENLGRKFESRKEHEVKDEKEHSPLPSHRPHKRMRVNNTGENGSRKSTECGTIWPKKVKIEPASDFSSHEVRDGDVSSIPRCQPMDGGTEKPLNVKQKAKSLEKAQEFKSTKPYFKVIIKPSAVDRENRSSAITVPANFAKKYFTNKKGGVIIHSMNGGTWFISYYCSESKTKPSSQIRFRGGWGQFAEDNNLKVGDVCVFEMIDCRDITLKVIIIRKSEEKSTHIGYNNSAGNHIKGRQAGPNSHEEVSQSTKIKDEAYKYPRFAAEIKCSYLQANFLYIPKSFAKNYIKTGASTTTLNVGDKSWQMEIFKHQNGMCKITAGWSAFVRENSLKEMDICNFELIQWNTCAFRVSISRNTSKSSHIII